MRCDIARPAVEYLKRASAKKRKNAIDHSLDALVSVYRRLRTSLRASDNLWASKTYLRCRGIEQAITGNRLNFVTFDDLVACTNRWVRSFPEVYDLIVGIPRSGLLVANIIASKLGKPLTTPDRLTENSVWMTNRSLHENVGFKKILLVDDRVSKGRELRSALATLRQHGDFQITKASLFVTAEAAHLVDLYYKVIPDPVLFEWNLMHAKKGNLATDLDGVICHNPPKGLDADEAAYLEWIRNARPYLVPLYEIDAIVSSRLERYRTVTEEWLAKNRVPYKKLILWDLPSINDRHGRFAKYKAEILLRIKPDVYWESNFNEAKQIYDSTRIPTLCVDRMIMFSRTASSITEPRNYE